MEPIFRRLIAGYDNELNQEALAAESRLDRAGLPVRSGTVECILRTDSICRALWSCRHIVERTLSELTRDSAIGATQWLCSDEAGVPFQCLV